MSSITMDPVRLEILWNGFRSIADETFSALMRSAYSTNIKERHDHSTGIVDAQGRLIAQAHKSLPIHLCSITGMIEALLQKFPAESISPGDIFVSNDPYAAGGTHLPDLCLAMPVFAGHALIGFACNVAHHSDIGGMSAGSGSTHAVEIYQEGLRVPPVLLFKRGELQQGVMDILLLNVRVPEEREGDYNAQIAACRLGERRLNEVIAVHGADVVVEAFREIRERTRRRFESKVAVIPDGIYEFTDYMDDHGYSAEETRISVKVTVEGSSIFCDFAGTSPAVAGGINSPIWPTRSAVVYALKALLDPEVPNNDGILQVCRMSAPEGCLINPVFPSPVVGRSNTCQRIVDAVLGALAPALPEQAVGAANGAVTAAIFSGHDARLNRPYVYLETIGGGFGGRNDRDGKDGVQVHTTNTSNLPTEALELEYPLFVERYELVDGSCGAGQYRGGLGLRRVIRPVGHTCRFSGQGERHHRQPWGVFGGGSAAMAHFATIADSGKVEKLTPDPHEVLVSPEMVVEIVTAGGGGYGPAVARDPALIARDVREGKVTALEAARDYHWQG